MKTFQIAIQALLALTLSGTALAQGNHTLAELSAALEQGMDVNQAEADGTTLLMRAIYTQNLEEARLLIESGATVNQANRYGVTPLYLATEQGLDDIAILLLAAGAATTTTTPDGETLLMTAAKAGSARIVRALLADDPERMMVGLDPNQTEIWKGQTALMWAAAEGHVDVMETLIEAGADINQRSAYVKVPEPDMDKLQGGFVYPDIPPGRMAPLHFAAREGQLEAVRALIEAGADLDIVDEQGTNALVLATINGHYDVAGLLLEAGADPNIQDEYGRSVLFVATDMHTLDANPRPAPRITSNLRADDIVRMALDHGAEPNVKLKSRLPGWTSLDGHNPMLNDGATPFFRAVMSGDLEVIEMLLAAGADPMLGTAEQEEGGFFGKTGGTSPFMMAAGLGWRESISRGRESDAVKVLEMLLNEYGADINARNQNGDTALHGAVMRRSAAIIEFLAANGADFTALNIDGVSALDAANGAQLYGRRLEPDPAIAALIESYMSPEDFAAMEAEREKLAAEAEARKAEEMAEMMEEAEES